MEADLWDAIFSVAEGRQDSLRALLDLGRAWQRTGIQDRIWLSEDDRYFYERGVFLLYQLRVISLLLALLGLASPYSVELTPFVTHLDAPIPPTWPRAGEIPHYVSTNLARDEPDGERRVEARLSPQTSPSTSATYRPLGNTPGRDGGSDGAVSFRQTDFLMGTQPLEHHTDPFEHPDTPFQLLALLGGPSLPHTPRDHQDDWPSTTQCTELGPFVDQASCSGPAQGASSLDRRHGGGSGSDSEHVAVNNDNGLSEDSSSTAHGSVSSGNRSGSSKAEGRAAEAPSEDSSPTAHSSDARDHDSSSPSSPPFHQGSVKLSFLEEDDEDDGPGHMQPASSGLNLEASDEGYTLPPSAPSEQSDSSESSNSSQSSNGEMDIEDPQQQPDSDETQPTGTPSAAMDITRSEDELTDAGAVAEDESHGDNDKGSKKKKKKKRRRQADPPGPLSDKGADNKGAEASEPGIRPVAYDGLVDYDTIRRKNNAECMQFVKTIKVPAPIVILVSLKHPSGPFLPC